MAHFCVWCPDDSSSQTELFTLKVFCGPVKNRDDSTHLVSILLFPDEGKIYIRFEDWLTDPCNIGVNANLCPKMMESVQENIKSGILVT